METYKIVEKPKNQPSMTRRSRIDLTSARDYLREKWRRFNDNYQVAILSQDGTVLNVYSDGVIINHLAVYPEN